MAREKLDTDIRRERIAQAALDLVAANGLRRLSVDSDAAAPLFPGLIQPPAPLWQISGEKFDVTRQARRAWSLYARALTGGNRITKAKCLRSKT